MRQPPDRADIPYTEIAPPADLAPYVDRFWLRSNLRGDPGRSYRVLPDGCVDVIVHADRGTAELVGTMTRAVEMAELPAELVGVRFKPGTAAALARRPLAELTDQQVDVAELGIAGGDVAARVSEARPATRVAVLAGWVRARLADARGPDPLVVRAVALLSAPDADLAGATRVERVAADLGVTRQHLARLFRREVGISPKELVRIARVQRATAAIGRGGTELARLAVELGYFDQSHLAHDVRELIGVTPSSLATERPVALRHLFERCAGAAPAVPFLQSPVRGRT